MVTIIGYNQTISQGLADLIQDVNPVQLEPLPNDSNSCYSYVEKILTSSRLIIINLDNIYNIGISLIKEIKKKDVTISIIAIDTHNSPSIIDHLYKQGICEYFPITADSNLIRETIKKCLKKYL